MVEEKPHLAGNSRLRQTTDQISSLILLSNSIKPFSSKWKLIRKKLEEILHILTSLSPEIQDSGEHPTFSGILQDLQKTTSFSTQLAHNCLEHSYSGKLLMQSDLDIICVKFTNFFKSLSEISSKDGVFSNGSKAIVVSRPGPTASRDDIKFYVEDLLSRFKIGDNEMKKQALVCFNEVIEEDERYVKVSMEIEGLVCVLMEFLSTKELKIQEQALKSVSVFCGFVKFKHVFVEFGVVAPLIRVLESGSELGKILSTRCLIKVTAESDNTWSVSSHGGVPALLKICGNCKDSGELVGLACGVLRNLIGVEEIKRFAIDKGVIPMFLKLVTTKNEVSQLNAIEFLQVLASGDEQVKSLIVNEGGIRVFTRVLDPKSSFSSKVKETSTKTLMNLCSNPSTLITLMSYGFMDHILHFLRNGEPSDQESALKAAFWLSQTSEDLKKAMGDAGFMPELVKFLGVKSFEARELAAETLSGLVLIPRNRKSFVQSDQNVSLILQMLDPKAEGTSGNRKLLLSIIMSLTSSNSGRKKIMNCGHLKNIEKLADAQVLDAKKIVRSINSSRFRGLIRRFWHS